MANETAALEWVRDNITSIAPAFPASTIKTAVALPGDYDDIPADNQTKWIGVWREPELHGYTPFTLSKGYYHETWRLGVFVLFYYGIDDTYSRQSLKQQEIGYVWRDALVDWIGDNETLGGNAEEIGDGEAMFYIDPFAPSPPWLQMQGWGTYMVIPIRTLRG